MLLYLIRHGQTQSNIDVLLDTLPPGADLAETGLAQAQSLAERLGDEPIEGVYSSNLRRAVQTATPLAERRGVPVTELPGLREIPAGVEEGKPYDAYLAALARWGTDPQSRLEGGESATEFVARFDAAIAQIAGRHQVAALVSHGAALRVWVPLRARNMTTGSGSEHHLGNGEVIVLSGDPESGWTALSWAEKQLDAIIRLATSADIPVLVALRRSMLEAMNDPADFEPGWEEAFGQWLARRIVASDYAMYVAEVAGEVVAGAQGEVIEAQPGPEVSRRRVFITNVSTLPGWRGRGYASRCMDALLGWARDQGAGAASLNAAPMGVGIYRRAGFTPSDHEEYRRSL